ncbi:hypothetical protein NBH00_10155 [Paraconexibacter antarcticus]|uniref:DUF4224 domain-containing protein n=1 Tax=Paraconexibacter antarcticus TaxID=2949664 RepID=A0ABY5DXZ3_9ACTN|nr:hypothetical protein [Paraconexibacter antarcticus]UTI66551.1 hypothetical protein NBH00_10155 [Paraconexibacter antarcticus]
MSEAENPVRREPGHVVTVDDVRTLMGASTPHFALQIRGRIARLIRGLPDGHPARLLGEQEIARLTALGFSGEVRGTAHEPAIRPLPSVDDVAAAEAAAHATGAH